MMKNRYSILTRDSRGRFASIRKGSKRIVTIYDKKELKKVTLLVDSSIDNFRKQIKKKPSKFFDNKTFKGVKINIQKHIPVRYQKKIVVPKEEIEYSERDSILYPDLKFFDTVLLGINIEGLFTIFKDYLKQYDIQYYNFGVLGLDSSGVVVYGKFTPNIIDLDNNLFIEQMIKLYDDIDLNKMTYKVSFQSVLRIVLKKVKGEKVDKSKRKSKKKNKF